VRMRLRYLMCVLLLLLPVAVQADFTFVQISDTHVGKDPAFNARYAEVVGQINALKPAFVIHTGDALADWSPENAALFKEISKPLAMPMYVVPGNHDAGRLREIGPEKGGQSIAAWKAAFGYDRISFEHEGCAFIGLNSNLFNSGFPAEKEHLDWLKAELKKAKRKRIFIFEHCALFLDKPSDPNGDYFATDEPARSEVLKLLEANHVEAVLTGHVHRLNESVYDGISFISTPATSFSCSPDAGLTGYRVFHVSKGGFTHRFVDLRHGGNPPDFQQKAVEP